LKEQNSSLKDQLRNTDKKLVHIDQLKREKIKVRGKSTGIERKTE